jgi:hypothetical protein
MTEQVAQTELEAYLDEALPPGEMARIEQALRADRGLLERLAELVARRDAGVHSLGAIWRRNRLSCFSRQQLGDYLLGTMEQAEADYVRFHLDVIGCRYCQANLADLESLRREGGEGEQRRRRYFQSSAGYLRK